MFIFFDHKAFASCGEVETLFKNSLILDKEHNVYRFQFEKTQTPNYFGIPDGEVLLLVNGGDARHGKMTSPTEIYKKATGNKTVDDFVVFTTVSTLNPETHLQKKKVHLFIAFCVIFNFSWPASNSVGYLSEHDKFSVSLKGLDSTQR